MPPCSAGPAPRVELASLAVHQATSAAALNLAAGLGERIAPPGPGRVYRGGRRVRLSDVDSDGVVRLDAVARYLQDVASDDVRDAGIEDAVAWVVRRTTVIALKRPQYGEQIELATWCSGVGAALAERRTTITGEDGSSVEAVSLWVSLDPKTLRPAPVGDEHFEPYRGQAGDRRVRSRLLLPGEPDGRVGPSRAWGLRASDFDLFRHVNNAVAWTAVEEEALRLLDGVRPQWGQVEYRRPLELGEEPVILGVRGGGVADVWLTGPDGVAVSARLGTGDPPASSAP